MGRVLQPGCGPNRIRKVVACATVAVGAAWLTVALAAPDERTREAIAGNGAGAPSQQPIRYGRDIRPILSDRCFLCHGPDAGTRAANLRLDERASATAEHDGIAAIVPGNPDASEVWRRITSTNANFHMPPSGSNKRLLNREQQELIRQWISEGAVYEPHWAFVPPVRPTPPAPRLPDWCRNPIDQFVVARLEQDGLAPSPETGDVTLIRRLFLDLTGLPPSPQEIDAFLADDRPDAYEQWVDRLLTEEPYRTRYAERMAVPWLDASRYADTSGIHMDAGRQMWLWRDWVLEAFRDNMPFDRFLIEQLAGDLLPDATVANKIASGFNRNHVTTDEGGAINEEYLVEYAADRTSTTGAVFLGLTLGCARCHDHKYDPVSQEDYYRFFAFFNSNEEPGLYSQLPDPNRALEPFLMVPTTEQEVELAESREKIARLNGELDQQAPEEQAKQATFLAEVRKKTGLAWEPVEVTATESTGGATLTPQKDGSVLASGPEADKEEHVITLRTDGVGLRLLLLEAMTDKSFPKGRVGRSGNGNAVLTSIEVEAASVANPEKRQAVSLGWAWADVEQENGDFRVVNVLDPSAERGWAVDGHGRKGGRTALLLADEPFGYEGGTELRVRLRYDSVYVRHVLGRVRLSVARLSEDALSLLPAAISGWYTVGPFPVESAEAGYAKAFGPEKDAKLDLAHNFGFGNQYWRFNADFRDAQVNRLADGVSVSYVGRRVLAPTARKLDVSLGSDDGFALFVNGRQVAAREVSRGVEPDQDKATIELEAGVNTVVLKIVNVAGPSGFYHRAEARPGELSGDLTLALLPETAQRDVLRERLRQAWRINHWPGYRERRQQVVELEKRIAAIEAAAPRTMVMRELATPRETFVLTRGEYDKPDKNRPVTRAVPAALGSLPENVPQNRLGLAQWLTSAENPLVARVMVNRLWDMVFGTGLVATTEDFGLQGDWPSHAELLDWLAVEFRESGWDVQHMVRLMVTSSTYRQSSRVRPELHDLDPDNRLLAYFPRRRLEAEFVRDYVLHVSGLLVEKLGGASVKPYQPEGLWREVAMIQSNTRAFQRGEGEALWRRSLYTYWKRACPPPSMSAFDAPTRESCVVRRSSTNTPLQALVLWNDEQFVEAARVLAARIIREPGEDHDRLAQTFRHCTGRVPEEAELERTAEALTAFRARYAESPDDAAALLEVGESPLPEDVDRSELAAWTMIANALFNLSETVTRH